MSGIEIAGLVLGAFPLAISAMEHFEQSKNVARTFYRIRRVHRKTLGKVKDCQLKFRLNMKALLLPLLVDDTVTKIEYEQLLANPGGAGWREEHVEEALAERLGECYERYIELLKEMGEVMVTLCKATKVDDEDFQALLKSRDGSTNTPAERDKNKLKLRAYTTTQAKKLAYAFTMSQKESLLDEVEALNSKLENVLISNDRISAVAGHPGRPRSTPRVSKHLLQFWRHADCMYKLLSEAWFCHCRGLHKTKLWLKQRVATNFDLQMMMRFCHGAQRCLHIELAANPLERSGKNPVSSSRLPLRPISQQSAAPSILVQHHHNTGLVAASSNGATTVTQTTSKVSWVSTSPQRQHQTQQQPLADIRDQGLCEVVKSLMSKTASADPIGFLTDPDTDSYYALLHSNGRSPTITSASQTTLSEVLRGNVSIPPTRLQRYTRAATLASSFVRFESTPWIREWTSNDVHFSDGGSAGQTAKLKYEEPFTLAQFDTAASPPGDNYKSFGILLLELCFGKPLEEYTVQQRPVFTAANTDPMVRHFVACQWLDDVEGEAGEHFADAVRHCLQQSPANLQNNKWREQFAQSVVWPLEQCVETMRPSRTTV